MKSIDFEGTDIRLKVTGSKLTRIDLLLNKLENIKPHLNLNKKIKTVVYDQTCNPEEFVEEVNGGIKDTEEIIRYYGENFKLDIRTQSTKPNTIIIRLQSQLKKEIQEEKD